MFNITHVDHPQICTSKLFKSDNFFYYLSKFQPTIQSITSSDSENFEKVSPKTLQEALIEYNKPLSVNQICILAKEILLAIQFIHSKDIVHLNLDPSNILILTKGLEDFFQTFEDIEGISKVKLINFCQASQFAKKIKFSEKDPMVDYT